MKKSIIVIIFLVILAGLSFLLPDLYTLGEIKEMNLYFYKGKFVLSSAECFVQDGQLMYYRSFMGNSYVSVGAFFIVGIISAVIILIGSIAKKLKKISASE